MIDWKACWQDCWIYKFFRLFPKFNFLDWMIIMVVVLTILAIMPSVKELKRLEYKGYIQDTVRRCDSILKEYEVLKAKNEKLDKFLLEHKKIKRMFERAND